MNIVITERSILPVRRDKQTGSSFTLGGGGGGSAAISGGSVGITAHSALTQLDYASAGHIGFAPIDSPVFITQITSPLIYGSSALNGDITIEGTSSATKTTSYVLLQPTSGYVGINTSSPESALNLFNGVLQIGMQADAYYTKLAVNSLVFNRAGSVSYIDQAGIGGSIRFRLSVTNPYDVSAMTIGPTGGLHIGGTSDAGDNNLLVDGTFLVSGVATFNDDLKGNETFVSGFTGSGWKLDKTTDYSLTVDNLTVRKMMRVYELEINKISSINGGIMVSVANGKVYSITENNIFDRWTPIGWDSFTSSGLEITNAVSSAASLAQAYFDADYEYFELAGTEITIDITHAKIAGTGVCRLIIYEEDAEVSNTILNVGANNITYTVVGANVGVSMTLSCGIGTFSFTSVSIKDDEEKIYFDEDESAAGVGNIIQFQANDYVRAQEWTGREIDYYQARVIRVFHSDILGYAHIAVEKQESSAGYICWEGADLVQVGNSSDTDRQNIIYITAADDNNPYIDMLSGVTDGDFAGKQILRIGNLTGIIDASFDPSSLSGNGLYSSNAYLTGKLVLPTAGMTNEGSAASSVRIYAGDTYANRAIAPYKVTQNGALTATGIAELGTAVGLDPESADTNNVAIKNCYIYESSRNDDAGSLYINSIGYQGGTTKYRNTYLGDGKIGYLLEAIGSKGVIAISKAFAFKPYEFSIDYSPSSIISSIYILTIAATASKTITFPVAADINTQFGGGKSAMYPVITIINQNATYNLNITTVSQTDTFWYSGNNTKTYVLAPHRLITMTFDSLEWYLLES